MSNMIEDKLKTLANDENMLKALRFVIDGRIDKCNPVAGDEDDNVLGQKYRAYLLASEIVKGLFTDIMAYKEHKPNKLINKER